MSSTRLGISQAPVANQCFVGTDKLYITHSEWASEDAFSASAGSGVSKSKVPGANFRRLPFNYCAVSLQPFDHPVCTAEGIIFDLINILPWLKKHGTNPIDGKQLKSSELIKLNFTKNDNGEYVDPVTYKPFTDNTHIVALRNTGNVFTYDTIERLNMKAKNWRDLVSDEEFSRRDIITLQDPQHLASRDLSNFKYIREGTSTLTEEQERERNDPTSGLNIAAMGSSAKIVQAKEAVAKARAERAAGQNLHSSAMNKTFGNNGIPDGTSNMRNEASTTGIARAVPRNAAIHTTGKAAASFTSTGVSVHTGNERALLSEEDYMLKPRRIKEKGYARVQTSHGDLNLELTPEYAPRAVWNFVQLAKRGYYKGIKFHRNIRHFMIQGGDPTGTGKGGQSIWGKPFEDEYVQSPLSHSDRGIISMANKGKNTNTSQFFITYRKTSHLDRKHTIFGKCITDDPGGETEATLKRLENVETDDSNRPIEDCAIEDVVVFIDPFEEYQKKQDRNEGTAHDVYEHDGDESTTTWTGKRVRQVQHSRAAENVSGVGKYFSGNTLAEENGAVIDEFEDPSVQEPASKKHKGGGFGNFDAW